MKILVTGATGKLGSLVIENLLKNVEVKQNKDGSYQVWGYYKGNGVFKTNANAVTVKDLNDPSLFDKLMENYDSYFN